MGRPNQTQERLDALLDGRPGGVTDDLAPLLAAAEALRAELAEFELDPEVVDRHLEQALDRPATVVALPVRTGGHGVLRRRVAAVVLAAALLLLPATAASASDSALPGQALYPVKVAVEQVRLAAVQWSPTGEAQERAKLAATRLHELHKLVQFRMYGQVPPAIHALDKAVRAANVAMVEAAKQEGADPKLVAVFNRLTDVAVAQHGELVALTSMANVPSSIALAVKGSPALATPTLPTVPPALQPAVTTLPAGQPQTPPTTSSPPAPTAPPVPPTSPPTTEAPVQPTSPPTTEPPVLTTSLPPPTDPPTTVASEGSAAGAAADDAPAGAGGYGESVPPSSGP